MNVRAAQRHAVLQMLNFNQPMEKVGAGSALFDDSHWSNDWKVLVFDRFCRDVISPLVTVKDLRRQGVTLHLELMAERDRIPDVPAIYFVQPTGENIRRIVADCAAKRYSAFYLNFSSPLPRAMLELMAELAIKNGCVEAINKVHDQFSQFVALEATLFSLNMPDSFTVYNDPRSAGRVEQTMDAIAAGLFGVLATLGAVPVIQTPRGGAAQMVASKLFDRVRFNLASADSLFAGSASRQRYQRGAAAAFERPLLLIVERGEDLATMLRHCSTYQALMHDVVDTRLNRISIPTTREGKQEVTTYHLDSDSDVFWRTYARKMFPDAIEANGVEMKEVVRQEAEIRSRTTDGGAAAGGANVFGDSSGGGADLHQAVQALPRLMERKGVLEQHTNILQATMQQVASRELPTFFEHEDGITTRQHVDVPALRELLAAKGCVSHFEVF
jgi:hypothetical protein